MLIDIKKIVTPEELQNNFNLVSERLVGMGEGFVFQSNKPTHVIMTIKHYESLINATGNNKNVYDEKDEGEGLEILLNKIGKTIFVDYYYVFKEDNSPEDKLPESFTMNSKRSRSSSARKIFKENLQIEALNNITQSYKLDKNTIDKAKKLLLAECNGKAEVLDLDFEMVDEMKIGKAVRMFFNKIAQSNILLDKEVENLLDEQFSKETFNLSFPVLKQFDPLVSPDIQKKDAHGYNRYYSERLKIAEKEYYLCSQWIENLHRDSFEKWAKDKMLSELRYKIEQLVDGTEFTVKGLLSDYWIYISHSSRKKLEKVFYNIAMVNNIIPIGKSNDIQVYRKG